MPSKTVSFLNVDEALAREAHAFLIGLLEQGVCDFDHLLPWLRRSLIRIG